MHRLLMSFLNQAFPEETGKNGQLDNIQGSFILIT